MLPDLPARHPGAGAPEAVRDAATRAGRRRRAPDPVLLKRVRDALTALPDSAQGPYYFQIGARRAHPAPGGNQRAAAR
ncbi:MAG TPA: hypothetical protein VHZ03_03690 [Trebonia sp.]|nr:hypothetical protein [Trebonia sp.]